jgi:hypothetical protein
VTRPTRADAAGRAYLDVQNLARRQRRPTQALLVVYVVERFLARLAAGPYSDRFVLKGGMLLAAWDARRATVDGDFLARGVDVDPDQIRRTVVEIASTPAPVEDGVEFLTDTATTSVIRDGDPYGGVRVRMHARVAGADLKLQLDVSTGDPVTPPPRRIAYPTLREVHDPLSILGYPMPMVLAEKLCTAVHLGAANTRVRDYADVWTLTGLHDVAAADLLAALQTTAGHRGVTLRPLTAAIGGYGHAQQATYTAFWRRLGPDADHLPTDFEQVVAAVTTFADPALSGDLPPTGRWDAATRSWR